MGCGPYTAVGTGALLILFSLGFLHTTGWAWGMIFLIVGGLLIWFGISEIRKMPSGKSKKSKEEVERQRQEWQALRREEEEADYDKLLQAIERIERLHPDWDVEIPKKSKATEYRRGLQCSAKYKSPDGISVYLTSGHTSLSAEARVGARTQDFCEIIINQEKTDTSPWVQLYRQKFYSDFSAHEITGPGNF